MSEITVSWDASPTPGASYNIFRGTAPGNEATTPYATGVTRDPVSPLTSVGATVLGVTPYVGTIYNGANNALLGMKVTVAGFANAVNNGIFVVASSSATGLGLTSAVASIPETAAAAAQPRPYYTDTSVLSGKIYVYEIEAMVGGVSSVGSVEVISPPVPYPPTPSAVDLGLVSSFEVLGGSTITNTGASVIAGDIGVYPGTSITGFGPPALISGVAHSADFVAAAAQAALTAAFNAAMAATPSVAVAAELGGNLVFTPGVYNVPSSADITGVMYLDAQGNPDAVWIFQIPSTLTTASSNSVVILVNGAQAQNVFWAVGSSATLNGPSTRFVGTVMAQASISVTSGVSINGRLLARTGAVTLIDDNIEMFLTASLAVYKVNTAYALGTIAFDCVSQTYQQVAVEGTTGATRPVFSAVLGATTQDGTVLWVSIDPALPAVLTNLPPSPPNTPPAPPAAPTNPSISSES